MAYSSYVIRSLKAEIERKKTKLKGLQEKKAAIDTDINAVETEMATLIKMVAEQEKEAPAEAEKPAAAKKE